MGVKLLAALLLTVVIVVAVNAVLQRNDLAQTKSMLRVIKGGAGSS